MLFLSRKWGESIILKLPNGDYVRAEFTQPKDGTRDEVRVGLEGPENVVFLRDELFKDDEWAEIEAKLDSYIDMKKGAK